MKKFTLFLLTTFISLSCLTAQHDRLVLGVYTNNLSSEKAKKLGFDNPHGEYITSVNQNTAAEQLGLQPFDYVYAIDGQAFSNDLQLHDILAQKKAGDLVEVAYIRNGVKMSGKAALSSSRESKRRHRSDKEDPFLGVTPRHVKNKVINGAAIDILDCTTAKAMGLQDGDVVTQIDDYPIIDWHDLRTAVNAREVGEPIKITVNRDGQQLTRLASIRSLASSHERPCPDEEATTEAKAPIVARNVSPAAIEEEAVIEEEILQLEDELAVTLKNVSQEESDAMKKTRNIDMPIVNNLQIEALNIFPNPNEGVFNLQFELPEQAATIVRVFSGNGRLIYQYNLGTFSGTFRERIDISDSAVGTYFLQIMQGGKSLSKKVIVAKTGSTPVNY